MAPIISTVIPVYNCEITLDRCIQSIVNQTVSELEIIIVDDGSEDNSVDICKEWEIKDSRIIFVPSNHQGAFQARKRGTQKAVGKYIHYMDADDWIEPQMYEYMISFLEINDAAAITSPLYEDDSNKVRIRTEKIEPGVYINDKYDQVVIPKLIYSGTFFSGGISSNVGNKIFMTTKMQAIFSGIEDGGKVGNDASCVYPYLIVNNSLVIIDKPFYHYCTNAESITLTSKKYTKKDVDVSLNTISQFAQKSKFSCQLFEQLEYCRLYAYIWFCPDVFDFRTNKILSIFGGINVDESVALYGAGRVGLRIFKYIKSKSLDIKVDIIDRNANSISTLFNIPIFNPEEVDIKKYDRIIITALKSNAVKSIKKDLGKLNLEQCKLSWVDEEILCNPSEKLKEIDKVYTGL